MDTPNTFGQAVLEKIFENGGLRRNERRTPEDANFINSPFVQCKGCLESSFLNKIIFLLLNYNVFTVINLTEIL